MSALRRRLERLELEAARKPERGLIEELAEMNGRRVATGFPPVIAEPSERFNARMRDIRQRGREPGLADLLMAMSEEAKCATC
jgi:hypothetical protein